MTRLVNDTRDAILEKLIRHKYENIAPVMTKERAEIAAAIYNHVYKPNVQDLMNGLPDGWLPTDDDIMIRFDTDNMRFQFNGVASFYGNKNIRYIYEHSVAPVHKRFPHHDLNGRTLAVLDTSSKLGKRIFEFLKLERKHCDEISDLYSQLRGLLYSFTTTEKLVEAWPEVKDFIPVAQKPITTLPAIPVADLNKSLGLV